MRKKNLINTCIFIGVFILSFIIISSCTKENNELEEQNEKEIEFEKELTVFDSLELNSISLKLTSKSSDVLDNYSVESFELIINPGQIEGIDEVSDDDLELSESNVVIGTAEPILTIEILNKNFQDNVIEYSLVDKVEDEDDELKSTEGCTWSGAKQIYDYDAICVKTRNNSGKRCNDINFAIYDIDENLLNSYSSTKKHGMTWTCRCDGGYGLIVSYAKQNKASFSTTWVYDHNNATYQAECP